MDSTTPLIAVTGMHRSGTSCCAGLLERCGLSLGTSHEIHNVPKEENPKGFFENREVVFINRDMLGQSGGCWYALPPPEVLYARGDRFKERIAQFNSTFNGDLVKDPLLCLTLQVWRSACYRLSHVVVCVRHPLSVARSLSKRNGFTPDTGLHLWYEYYLRLLGSVDGMSVSFFDFDACQNDPAAQVEGILACMDMKRSPYDIRNAVGDFYDTTLDRNRVTMPDHDSADIPANVRTLYQVLHQRIVSS